MSSSTLIKDGLNFGPAVSSFINYHCHHPLKYENFSIEASFFFPFSFVRCCARSILIFSYSLRVTVRKPVCVLKRGTFTS